MIQSDEIVSKKKKKMDSHDIVPSRITNETDKILSTENATHRNRDWNENKKITSREYRETKKPFPNETQHTGQNAMLKYYNGH